MKIYLSLVVVTIQYMVLYSRAINFFIKTSIPEKRILYYIWNLKTKEKDKVKWILNLDYNIKLLFYQ